VAAAKDRGVVLLPVTFYRRGYPRSRERRRGQIEMQPAEQRPVMRDFPNPSRRRRRYRPRLVIQIPRRW